jgi:APA family basic amino acid/polyamine antiporter
VKTPAPAPAHGELLRVLGAGFGLAVVIGGTVGLGILRSPAVVAEHAGSAAMSLMLWGLGGLYALLAAASYADLATSIARSGGVYVYARSAMGNGGGFHIDDVATKDAVQAAAMVVIFHEAVIGDYAHFR